MVVFDSDIFIWFFRGDEGARELLNMDEDIAISIITYMEIIQGARDKGHLAYLLRFLRNEIVCRVLPTTENISYRAAIYVEDYVLSHNLQFGDALIAATAVEYGLSLYSSNEKHFRMIQGLNLRVFHPANRRQM